MKEGRAVPFSGTKEPESLRRPTTERQQHLGTVGIPGSFGVGLAGKGNPDFEPFLYTPSRGKNREKESLKQKKAKNTPGCQRGGFLM